MSERKDLPSFEPKPAGEPAPVAPSKPGSEGALSVRRKEGSMVRGVLTLSTAELLELKQYLDNQRINIKQPRLQKGQVSAGYANRGAIELGDGRIAFIPNQNNEKIVGTPHEFLLALKNIDQNL